MDVTVKLSANPIKFLSPDGQEMLANLFHFRLFRKQCNAYAYIPYDSFRPKQNSIGCFRGEVLRMLIRCSVFEEWLEECKRFAYLVRSRGHRWREIEQVMLRIKWSQRNELLEKALRKHKGNDRFFEQYNACVFSIRRTPCWKETKQLLDLNLSAFQDACGGAVFWAQAFCTFTSSLALRTFVPKDLKAAMHLNKRCCLEI